MYTKQQIFEIAMEQSAADNHCTVEDFLKPDHVMVDFALGEQARKYYKEPITCNFVSYGSNIVASVKPEYRELVWKYLHKFEFYHCFETPSMNWLAEQLTPMGQKICFMAEYFLPDPDRLTVLSCDYDIIIAKGAIIITFVARQPQKTR